MHQWCSETNVRLQKFNSCEKVTGPPTVCLINMGILLHAYVHPFNGPFSRTTRVSRYQKGRSNLDLTEARDSEWQWHQLGHIQACTSLQTDNHASTPPLSFLQARCPSGCPTKRQSTEGTALGLLQFV